MELVLNLRCVSPTSHLYCLLFNPLLLPEGTQEEDKPAAEEEEEDPEHGITFLKEKKNPGCPA